MKHVFTFIFLFTLVLPQLFAQNSREAQEKKASEYLTKYQHFKNHNQPDSAFAYSEKAAHIFAGLHIWRSYIEAQKNSAELQLARSSTDSALLCYRYASLAAQKHLSGDSVLNAGLFETRIQLSIQTKDSVRLKKIQAEQDAWLAENKHKKQLIAKWQRLGDKAAKRNDKDSALFYYTSCLKIYQDYLKIDNRKTMVLHDSLSSLSLHFFDYRAAQVHIEAALEIAKTIYKENNNLILNQYERSAQIFEDIGYYDWALEYANEALLMRKKFFGEKDTLLPASYATIGRIHTHKLNFEYALEYYRKTLELLRNLYDEAHPKIAHCHFQIGRVYNRLDEPHQAERSLKRSISICKQVLGTWAPLLGASYIEIGKAYAGLKEFDRAHDFYDKAIAVFHQNKLPLREAAAHHEKGNTFLLQQKPGKALNSFQRELILCAGQFPESHDVYRNPDVSTHTSSLRIMPALQGKADAFSLRFKKSAQEKDLNAAQRIFALYDRMVGNVNRTYILQRNKVKTDSLARLIYENAIELHFGMYQNDNDPEHIKRAFRYSETSKNSAILQTVGGANVFTFADVPDSLTQREYRIKSRLKYWKKNLHDAHDPKVKFEFIRKIKQGLRSLDSLISRFSRKYPAYYQLKYDPPQVLLSDIQENMDRKDALLHYFCGKRAVYIIWATRKETHFEKWEKNEQFDIDLDIFQNALTSPENQRLTMTFAEMGHLFYQRFFPKQLSASNVENLSIVPDGMLGRLPFEALLFEKYQGEKTDFAQYPFLLKKYQINYSYSAGTHFSRKQQQGTIEKLIANSKILLMAPVFSKPEIAGLKKHSKRVLENLYSEVEKDKNENAELYIGDRIVALPESENEVSAVSSRFSGKSALLVHQNATEAFMKSDQVRPISYLHLATHGFVNYRLPQHTGILLAADTTSNEDGFLYLKEIFNLKLNADLVVLSGYEGSLGKIHDRRGYYGLSAAWSYAGAQNLIISLWKVTKKSTPAFMEKFYFNCAQQRPKDFSYAEALRQTKLRFSEDKNFGHPFYWATFVLIN